MVFSVFRLNNSFLPIQIIAVTNVKSDKLVVLGLDGLSHSLACRLARIEARVRRFGHHLLPPLLAPMPQELPVGDGV